MVLILTAMLTLLSACTSTKVIRDSEYKHSEAAFRSGDVNQALERFPKKERHGFVTSIEKAWLGLWNGETENSDLLKQARTLDERNFTSVSREAQYFFYSESEDGYIPAEHEIIIMHLLSSMYFLRSEKWTEARVEAQRATFFLQNYVKEGQAHFDDPALRLWLAGIWAALGEWNEAQVDLRKAYELSKNKNLLPLLEKTKPPENFTVLFDGSGPLVTWKEGVLQPNFADRSTPPSTTVHFSTLPWFLRHQERNSEIRNIVMKSNYMTQYYGLNTSIGAQKTMGFAASNTLRVAGLLIGSAIVGGGLYALASMGGASGTGEAAGYLIGAGFVAGSTIWEKGDKVAQSFDASTAESKKSGLENLRIYRFVRFLPSWISISTQTEAVLPSAQALHLKSPQSVTSVLFLQRF